jgi:hypothetical protein
MYEKNEQVYIGVTTIHLALVVVSVYGFVSGAILASHYGDLISLNRDRLFDVFPTDGLNYLILSSSFTSEDFFASFSTENNVAAVNWSTIVLLGSLLKSLFGEQYVLAIFFVNLGILFLAAKDVLQVATYYGVAPRFTMGVLVFCQPYLFFYLPVLNKEVIVLWCLAASFASSLRGNYLAAVLVVICCSLFKVQLLGVVAIAGLRRVGFSWIWIVMGLSLLLSFVPMVDLREFLVLQGNEIRTAVIAQQLDDLVSYPFGFLLAAPGRLALNFGGGFSPWAWENARSVSDWSYLSTSTVLAVSGVVFILDLLLHSERKTFLIDYLISYIVVFSTIPFVQSRYYWVLVPFLWISVLSKPSLFRNVSPFAAQFWGEISGRR